MFDHLFNDWTQGSAAKKLVPAVNVKETDKDFRMEVAVPGFKKEDFKVEFEQDVLRISGEKKEEQENSVGTYTRREFSAESFMRTFRFPENTVDSEKIHAKYENGILNITVPKRDEAQAKPARTIEIG